MIYDCFNFCDELDLLELRLMEYADVVDRFVLVESTVTFTNRPKELVYAKNKKRFSRYADKIIHVVVDDSPDVSLPWIIEHFQFAAVSRGLKNCKPKDVILLSGIDEFPRRGLIRAWASRPGKHKMFSQRVCEYYLNFAGEGEGSQWPCTSMFLYKDVRKYQDPYVARFSPTDVLIPDGGWHFTFMGDFARIQRKLSAWSHQEYNNDRFNTREYIELVTRHGEDILGRKLHFAIQPLSFLPEGARDNPKVFAHLLLTQQPRSSFFIDVYLRMRRTMRLLFRFLRRII